uniref:Uncharacterized protein n=1 Tax=Arundo donax TaxID=35708 RepID=A0A0A9EGF2_ARUDO
MLAHRGAPIPTPEPPHHPLHSAPPAHEHQTTEHAKRRKRTRGELPIRARKGVRERRGPREIESDEEAERGWAG